MDFTTESQPIVEAVLQRYRDRLGAQAGSYRHHVYRGLAYHRILYGATLPETAVLAWAVHDLGIWTAGTLDYLGPSADLADEFAEEFGVADLGAVRAMVLGHHRLRPVDDVLAETFRRADLIDVSRGLLRGTVAAAVVSETVGRLPYGGFHRYLATRIARYAVAHPRRPLPMLRW